MEIRRYRSLPSPTLHPARTQHANSDPDIDDKSLHYARANIARNNLGSHIRLLKTLPTDPLIPLDALGIDQYVLFPLPPPPASSRTLTNPPTS